MVWPDSHAFTLTYHQIIQSVCLVHDTVLSRVSFRLSLILHIFFRSVTAFSFDDFPFACIFHGAA